MTLLGLLALLGVAFVSALIPVVNLEVYLGGLAVFGASAGAWDIAVLSGVAAAGQMVGKLLFFLAGRGALTLPARLRHDAAPPASARRVRTAARLVRWQERVQARPWLATAFVGGSASVGLPPFAVVSVLAGSMRVPLPVFAAAGLVGRWARFAVVLIVVGASAG